MKETKETKFEIAYAKMLKTKTSAGGIMKELSPKYLREKHLAGLRKKWAEGKVKK